MARTSKNPSIRYKSDRDNLEVRRDPHWHLIAEGQHLGYRKTGDQQGSWVARYYTSEHGRRFQALGMADDTVEANGTHVLSFKDALKAAETWFAKTARADRNGVRIGPYTVQNAAEDWLKTQSSPTSAVHVKNDILPELGNISLQKLTKATLHNWLQKQGQKPTVRSLGPNSKVAFDINDPETRRKRQDTANRVLRTLKALLNLAWSNQFIETNDAWVTLKEFPKVARQRTEYLTLEQGARFIEACPDDFSRLVRAALYSGSRYSELCELHVGAFDAENKSLAVMQGKTGNEKIVFLTDDEADFFAAQVKDKQLTDLMFLRSDGTEWKKDHQKQRMKAACKAAKIEQRITFHNLRHTFASLLAMSGVRPELIQTQMGHSSQSMTKRYTHFSRSYAESTIRNNKPSLGFGVKLGPQLVEKAG